MADVRVRKLGTLLDAENAALRSADFDAITQMAEEKARLVESLGNDLPRESELAQLRERAAANARLFAAAIKGVKTARERLDVLRTARSELSIYTEKGEKSQVIARRKGLERKA